MTVLRDCERLGFGDIEAGIAARQDDRPLVGDIVMCEVERLARRGELELRATGAGDDHEVMLEAARTRGELAQVGVAFPVGKGPVLRGRVPHTTAR